MEQNINANVNLDIEQFKRELIDKINSSPFPISITYYLLKDVFTDFQSGYFNYINQASQQIQAAAAQPEPKEEDVEIIPPENIQD